MCGSVGFAACAIAALLKRLKAAIAALNRTRMFDTPVTPVASPRRLVVGAQELDDADAPRFPDFYAP